MNPDQVLEEGGIEFDAAYEQKTGKSMKSVGIDPISIIIAIITFLSQMCPKPPAELKAEAGRRGPGTLLAARSATRQALREKHGPFAYRRFDGDAMADAALDVIANKDEEKIRVVQNCCAG